MSRTDPEHYLRRDDFGGRLRVKATRGVAFTLGAQWTRFAIQIGSTAVLARLLTPDDYGLVGMVLAITGLAELVKDLGLSAATVQRRDITHPEVSKLFWVNAAFGVVLAMLGVALAPVVAAFYDRSELTAITMVLSVTFVFGGLAVQHQALIMRKMRFAALGTIEVTATLCAATAAIIGGASGLDYWALVLFYFVLSFVRMVGYWIASPWRPGPYRRDIPIGSMMTFGGNVSAFNVLNYLSRNLDNVLIGRYRGAGELGLYTRAYQLLLLPLQQINQPVANVAIPTLSYLQNDAPRYRSYYRTAIAAIAFVAMPVVVLLAALSDEVIHVLLGPDWSESARIFRVLAFAGLAQTISNTNGWIYVSTGRTGRMAVWALVSRPLLIASFAIGLPWGAYGVAISYTICSLVLLVPGFLVAVHGSPVDLRDIALGTWRALVLSGAAYLVAVSTKAALGDTSQLLVLAVAGAAGVATFLACTAAWRPARRELVGLVGIIRGSVGGRRDGVDAPTDAATPAESPEAV